MLLNLPQVTLYGLDLVSPEKTLAALQLSMRWVQFAEVVLVTTTKFQRAYQSNSAGIRVVGLPYKEAGPRVEYERLACFYAGQVVQTSHVLHLEWDACIANPLAWQPEWLTLDYIGAPWPRHYEVGWPACEEYNCVGNGGFSLRSVRLYSLLETLLSNLSLADEEGLVKHDSWIGRTLRPYLQHKGMAFGTPQQAARFACENQFYSGQFGLHGVATFWKNGFALPVNSLNERGI